MSPEVAAAHARAKARKPADQGRVNTLANALDSSWGRLIEKLGGLGVLALMLWLVFANLLPAQQAAHDAQVRQAIATNETQAKAFLTAIDTMQKASADEGARNRKVLEDLTDAIKDIKNSGSGAR